MRLCGHVCAPSHSIVQWKELVGEMCPVCLVVPNSRTQGKFIVPCFLEGALNQDQAPTGAGETAAAVPSHWRQALLGAAGRHGIDIEGLGLAHSSGTDDDGDVDDSSEQIEVTETHGDIVVPC